MKNLHKNLTAFGLVALGYFVMVGKVLAAWDGNAVSSVTADSKLGSIGTMDQLFIFLANIITYVGWAGVIIAILAVIALLIFKLIGEDSENTMKTVQGGITKAVIIALLGLLLLSAGFFVKIISGAVGEGGGDYSIDGGLTGDGATEAPAAP